MLGFSKKSRNKRILPTFPSMGTDEWSRVWDRWRFKGDTLFDTWDEIYRANFFPSVFRRPEVDGSLKERELEIGKSEETR